MRWPQKIASRVVALRHERLAMWLQRFRLKDGSFGEVDLGGTTVIFGYFFPGPTLYDGHGTGRLYIDESATSAQVEALEEIMQGKKGGPMEVTFPSNLDRPARFQREAPVADSPTPAACRWVAPESEQGALHE